MTETMHRITITIHDVDVNLRTNGDGFEYAKVKDVLRAIVRNAMQMSSDTLITGFGVVSIDDEVIA